MTQQRRPRREPCAMVTTSRCGREVAGSQPLKNIRPTREVRRPAYCHSSTRSGGGNVRVDLLAYFFSRSMAMVAAFGRPRAWSSRVLAMSSEHSCAPLRISASCNASGSTAMYSIAPPACGSRIVVATRRHAFTARERDNSWQISKPCACPIQKNGRRRSFWWTTKC